MRPPDHHDRNGHSEEERRMATMEGAPVALMLLSASCGGKHTITKVLEARGVAKLVIRDTTRKPLPSDNGTNRCISDEEFFGRLSPENGYVSVITSGTKIFYGHRIGDVLDVWGRNMVPVLRGLPGGHEDIRRKLERVRPGCRIMTVFMVTDPEDAWQGATRVRDYVDVEDRIRESLRQTERALRTFRSHIDHVVTNVWGRPEEAAARIEEILRAV